MEIDQPNVYYTDKADEETVKLNWIRLYLERKLAHGDTPISFDYEKLIITYENPLTKAKRQTRIITGKRRIDFGGSVFHADESKIEEIKEVLLCGQSS